MCTDAIYVYVFISQTPLRDVCVHMKQKSIYNYLNIITLFNNMFV